MGFVKAVKNKAYSKRYQVKYKRRREGKTDYYARKRMVANAKNKYGSPKYRFVVRFTNKDIICQVVSSKIKGDFCHAAAYAHELPRYGVKVGLTNYSAAYCVGLLCARRLLVSKGLADNFEGTPEVTAEFDDCYVHGNDEDGPNAFHALLDVGLKRTTLGSKLFSALKGAFDGGLEIPHSEKKFYGYDADEKSYDAEANRERILGGHVAEYMRSMEEEEPEEYAAKFAKYIAAGMTADNLEDKYLEVHQKIRADPTHKPSTKNKPSAEECAKCKSDGGIRYTKDGKEHFINRTRRTLAQRKNRVAQIKAHTLATLGGDDSEDEESDE
jgi:large subunit ribosomal protein L5e